MEDIKALFTWRQHVKDWSHQHLIMSLQTDTFLRPDYDL